MQRLSCITGFFSSIAQTYRSISAFSASHVSSTAMAKRKRTLHVACATEKVVILRLHAPIAFFLDEFSMMLDNNWLGTRFT